MQQRVERPTARVRERGGDQITGGAVTLVALLAHSRCGKGFEFAERNARRFFMCRHQPVVIHRHGQHRNRFRRGTGEIIKYAPLIGFFLPQCQTFVVIRIFVFTQRMKLITGDGIGLIPAVPRPHRSTGRAGFHRRRSNRSAPDARRSSLRHPPDSFVRRL